MSLICAGKAILCSVMELGPIDLKSCKLRCGSNQEAGSIGKASGLVSPARLSPNQKVNEESPAPFAHAWALIFPCPYPRRECTP